MIIAGRIAHHSLSSVLLNVMMIYVGKSGAMKIAMIPDAGRSAQRKVKKDLTMVLILVNLSSALMIVVMILVKKYGAM